MDSPSDADQAPPTLLTDLPTSLIVECLSSLPPNDASRLACTTSSLSSVADDELLRMRHLHDQFGLGSPTPPPSSMTSAMHTSGAGNRNGATIASAAGLGPGTGSPLLSNKQAFKMWMNAFPSHLYAISTVRACLDAWLRIETFLASNRQEILVEPMLPEGFKAIWRVHDGQQLSYDQKFDQAQKTNNQDVAPDASIAHGLFGGYSFYNHFKCTRMLSLDRIAYWTSRLRRHSWLAGEGVEGEEGWVARRPNLIVFALSFDLGKIFVLDTLTSEIFILSGGRMQSASPDGILPWFQEYARRLHEGWYSVGELYDGHGMPPTWGVCLFAEKGPGVSIGVTRGVQVKVSTVYAAEATQDDHHTFAYSVRFLLLPKEEQEGERKLHQCQLNSRHWIVRNEDGEVEDEIRGDGVIGLFPLLREGGAESRCRPLPPLPPIMHKSSTPQPLVLYTPTPTLAPIMIG